MYGNDVIQRCLEVKTKCWITEINDIIIIIQENYREECSRYVP